MNAKRFYAFFALSLHLSKHDKNMKKIITAMDSFKGCMTSHQANEAVREGLLEALNNNVEVISFDVSDGGEGFLEAMRPDEIVHCHVHDAMMRWEDSAFGIKNGVGVIEVARAAGLTMIEPEYRNPLVATSYGVGELIANAYRRGCREFVVGLGGSATSDCGLGMLRALRQAWQTAHGKMWYDNFDTSVLKELKVTVATDVTNPLYGSNGAAKVFAQQKGATQDMIELLDRRAKTFAKMAALHQGYDASGEAGAGAAGGLGYAFMEFMTAEVKRGADVVLDALNFDDALNGAEAVVTGEGSSDNQTLMGKLPSVVLQRAKEKNIPVYLLAGRIPDKEPLKAAGFSKLININDGWDAADDVLREDVAEKRLKTACKMI
jgi:glycerate kinase